MGGRDGDNASDRQFNSDRDTYGRLGLDSNGLPPVPQEWIRYMQRYKKIDKQTDRQALRDIC